MKFSVDNQERYTLFRLEEENLNSLIAPDLKSKFVIIRNEGVKNLILNLADVKYVDSSGLSAILTADRIWKGFGAFILTGIEHENVKKLIKISRLTQVFTIIPTVAEAIDYVLMDEIERELNADPEE
ncbi:MAG: STAS domain-containing protein [Bacteroidota bacterium]